MSASKRKGTGAETAIVRFLREEGFPHAERRALNGAKDRGDIAGIPGLVIESKAGARCDLAEWVDEATVEQANDGADYGVVWHKRRGRTDPAAWFVTLTGAQFVRLLRSAGYGIEPTQEAHDA